jgi:hypothetical protein
MFTRPPLLPVLVGIWLIPIILGLIIDPFGGWTMYLPKPAAAAFRLREAEYFDRSGHCDSGSQSEWRETAAGPHPETWFRSLATEAVHPAGRLYGIIGLYEVDRLSFGRIVQSGLPFESRDSIPVFADGRLSWSSGAALLRQPTLDSILRVFREASPRPICD